MNDNPVIMIEGEPHYTVTYFAALTRRSPSRIHQLITSGNATRKLKCTRVGGKPFIPTTEVDEFPFKVPQQPKNVTPKRAKKEKTDDDVPANAYVF